MRRHARATRIGLRFALALGLVALVTYAQFADGGAQPSVGLYWTSNTIPTAPPGQAAPLWQLLIRTDTPSLYYKSGPSNTDWTPLGAGASGGGTVTSITCGSGIECTPDPITTTGQLDLDIAPTTCAAGQAEVSTNALGASTCATFVDTAGTGIAIGGSTSASVNLTTTTCASGSAEITTAANGTSTCAAFVNAAGTGLSLSGSTASLNITPTTCAAGSAKIATAANGTATCSPFVTTAFSGTSNTVAKFTSSTAVGNSSVTDDGTTWAINTNKVSVTEASGNTTIAGTLDTPNALITASGGLTSTASTTTVGNLVFTQQANTTDGTQADLALNSSTTTVTFDPTPGTTTTIQGMTGGTDGRTITAYISPSGSSRTATYTNNSGTAGNRVANAAASTVTLQNGASSLANASAGTIWIYNATRSKWMEVARSGPRFNYALVARAGIKMSSGGARINASAGSDNTLSSCGTGPSITHGQVNFTVTTGTGATGCTISFITSINNPSTCIVTSQSGVQPAYSYTNPSLILGAGTTASTKYDINCIMH